MCVQAPTAHAGGAITVAEELARRASVGFGAAGSRLQAASDSHSKCFVHDVCRAVEACAPATKSRTLTDGLVAGRPCAFPWAHARPFGPSTKKGPGAGTTG